MTLATIIHHGITYNYVKSSDVTMVMPRTVIDFAVIDNKGRAVGMYRSISHKVTTLCEEGSAPDAIRLYPVGKPLAIFVGHAMATRNGNGYGSADIRVEGATLEEVAKELDARIERARKAAVKKWAAKVAA